MSILDKMRSGTDSTPMQILLAVIIIALFFWYGNPQGDTTRTVITVNGEPVRDTEYIPKYREAYARMQAQGFSPEQEEELQFQVKQAFAKDVVLRQLARDLGLTTSKRDIDAVIEADWRFRNPDTRKYDPEIFLEFRNSSGQSVSEFEQAFKDIALRTKLRWLVMMGVDISPNRARDYYVENETKVDVQYVRIDPSNVQTTLAVSDTEIDTWLATNESKAKDKYDADFKRLYDIPERLNLSVIRLNLEEAGPTEDELKERLTTVRTLAMKGGSFGELARKWSEDSTAQNDGVLGERRLPTFTTEERTALTDVKPGDFTEVLSNGRSVYFFRLDKRTAAEVVDFEQVKREISDNLIRTGKASGAAQAMADSLKSSWDSEGSPSGQILLESNLAIEQSGLTGKGQQRVGGAPAELINAALEAGKTGVLNEVYSVDSGNKRVLFVASVSAFEPADMEAFETQKGQLHESLLLRERMETWEAWSEAKVAEADIKIH